MLTTIAIAVLFFVLGLVLGNSNARRSVANVFVNVVRTAGSMYHAVVDVKLQSIGRIEPDQMEVPEWAVEAAGWYLVAVNGVWESLWLAPSACMDLEAQNAVVMPLNAGYKIDVRGVDNIGYIVENEPVALAVAA